MSLYFTGNHNAENSSKEARILLNTGGKRLWGFDSENIALYLFSRYCPNIALLGHFIVDLLSQYFRNINKNKQLFSFFHHMFSSKHMIIIFKNIIDYWIRNFAYSLHIIYEKREYKIWKKWKYIIMRKIVFFLCCYKMKHHHIGTI